MSAFSIIEDFRVKTNQAFLDKAAVLEPVLNRRTIKPKYMVSVEEDQYGEAVVRKTAEMWELSSMHFRKGNKVVFDFGDHQVGYVSFTAEALGSHFDAPAYIRLKFAEVPAELMEDSDAYDGWLSKSWIQEDVLHLDILPYTEKLPRRYAFRYMQIEILDTSPKYSLKLSNIICNYASAVEMSSIEPLGSEDEMLNDIDRISIKTLMDCMQKVFEDGPKRDRRLWLGDFRLQARVNYVTFKNFDMVKRCLYLFAGMTFHDGRMGACFFHEPDLQVDDTYLMDYALFFCPVLWDYYEASGDEETLQELYPQAVGQINICIETMLDENHIVIDQGETFWCFLDWGEGLNKQAGAQAVLIYAIRYGIRLARALGDYERVQQLEKQMDILKKAAVETFWNEELGMFVSGNERQVSWATQVWMILARVFNEEKSRELILHTQQMNPEISMVTPYMYHHYVDALIQCKEEEKALAEMKRYWGGMIKDGADTFWEVYNPCNKQESPYGCAMVNSYCHAWSCTPAYLLRKFYKGNEKFKELFRSVDDR
ncbi:MAG: sugar hydrolase [Lachnospiraceae bacterium]|nr:sugar hydrolase [Lachnospiraceae bacterium]